MFAARFLALVMVCASCRTDNHTAATVAPVVLVTRDSNELRFINDGPDDLTDCTVTIDGNYSATLRDLPTRQRKFLVRAQFSDAMPTDEFYSRALRSTTMECATSDGYGGKTRTPIRLK